MSIRPVPSDRRRTRRNQQQMAVRIRLTRVGATKQPTYRVVVADGRSARDSRAIEIIGHYNPRTEPIELSIDAEKASAWLAKGAQPSDTVLRLLRTAGIVPAEKR
jgi:small subunit ribosomal protein S16